MKSGFSDSQNGQSEKPLLKIKEFFHISETLSCGSRWANIV